MPRDPFLPKFAPIVPDGDPFLPTDTGSAVTVAAELVERSVSGTALELDTLASSLLSWQQRVNPDESLVRRVFASFLERIDIRGNSRRAADIQELSGRVALIMMNFREAQRAKVELMELLARERGIQDYASMHKRLTQAELEAQIAEAEARVATAKMKKRMAEQLE